VAVDLEGLGVGGHGSSGRARVLADGRLWHVGA